MNEKIFILESLPAEVLYGPGSPFVEGLTQAFPKLKIVCRGEQVKALGDPPELARLEEKLDRLVTVFERKGRLSAQDLQFILGVAPEATDAPPAPEDSDADVLVYGNNGRIIKARTPNQAKLVKAYRQNDLIFAEGPAGTGKTYTAIALAVKALRDKEIRRIILTRPAVEAGERLGFLPGDLKEKLDPYLQPLYDALHDMIPNKKLEGFMEDGTVQIAPLAYMRGRTLDKACVILDEAQNTSLSQLRMFLTRMGADAKFIITGDSSQVDLPRREDSGLDQCIRLLRPIRGIAVIRFTPQDIIRHPLVKKIVAAFDAHNKDEAPTEDE